MYDNIRGKISSTALELVQMQISAPHPQKNVEVFFIAFMGFCEHTMHNKVAIGGKLEMDDFDRHAHLLSCNIRWKYCQCIAAGALWYWEFK